MTASFTSLVSDYLHQAVSANDSISLTLILTLTLATLFLYLIFFNNNNNSSSSSSTTSQTPLPPTIPHSIPFIGNAIPFGMDPVGWIKTQQLKYGDTFTFTMMGRRMTMCLGEQGNHFVFNVPVKQATAEGAYVKLMRPVFGKEVVYDVDNATFMEQKK